MKYKYTNFLLEIKRFQSKNKYNIVSIVLFIIIITILLIKAEFMYNTNTYIAPIERTKIDQIEISTTTIDFIKSKEGFSELAYKDGDRYSVGYGTKAEHSLQTINKSQAEVELKKAIKEKQEIVEKAAEIKNVDLTENQMTALVSLSYNAGERWAIHILEKESRGEVFIEDFTEITSKNPLWKNGLTKRRVAEWKLYNY